MSIKVKQVSGQVVLESPWCVCSTEDGCDPIYVASQAVAVSVLENAMASTLFTGLVKNTRSAAEQFIEFARHLE